MPESIIKVHQLTKEYLIGNAFSDTFRGRITSIFNKTNKEHFLALDNITFDVKAGEVFGVIGRNGAGKSTLLKILSKITYPTSGRVEIIGNVCSLLEVGTGFHPELSGRENIFLNGTILGMSRKEINLKFDEIVDFSGVSRFIDTPVKHYSSGMYVRLAFSVAAHLQPEILIIDEVLAVGDIEFQNKCLGKLDEVASQGKTVLFVSHNMAAVNRLCSKVILLDQGRIAIEAAPIVAIKHYHDSVKSNDSGEAFIKKQIDPNKHFQLTSVESSSVQGQRKSTFEYESQIRISFETFIKVPSKNYYIYLGVQDEENNILFVTTDEDSGEPIYNKLQSGRQQTHVIIPGLLFKPGKYFVTINCEDRGQMTIDENDSLIEFEVIDTSTYRGSNKLYRADALLAPGGIIWKSNKI